MKIQLSISQDYRPTWGMWEGVREVVQNYLDAEDEGFAGSINYSKSGVLSVKNGNVTINSAQLGLLGESTKAENDALRGQFGEGIKIGILALIRAGYHVSVRSGSHAWKAVIEDSKQFGKKVLTFISRKSSYYNGVEVKILGINEDEWVQMKDNFLPLREKYNTANESQYGSILSNESDKGKVFVKGIFVDRDAGLRYGYDFKNASTDIDRKMVRDWDLRYHAAAVVNHAVNQGIIDVETYLEMFMTESKDVEHAEYHVSQSDFEKLNQAFIEKHGDNSVPVSSKEESAQLEHYGINGIHCPRAMNSVFNKYDQGCRQRLIEAKLAPKKVYKWEELDIEEQNNVFEVFDLLKRSEVSFLRDNIYFVDFLDETLGTFTRTETETRINIAKKILTNKVELLKTIVEEVAHNSGGDGSFAHKLAMHDMYARIIAAQTGW
jgi:hypothetical protein